MKTEQVEVRTSEYAFSHGKQPRGFGSWCFSRYEDVDFCNRDNPSVIWVHQSTYAAARKAALKQAKALGWEVMYTQP